MRELSPEQQEKNKEKIEQEKKDLKNFLLNIIQTMTSQCFAGRRGGT